MNFGVGIYSSVISAEGIGYIVGDPVISKYYEAVITGAADSLPDYPIRLESFSCVRKSGGLSSFRITCPYIADLVSAANARLNGEVILYRNKVSVNGVGIIEAFRFNLNEVRFFEGGSNSSIQLLGSKTVTYTNPNTVTIETVFSFELDSFGRRVIETISDLPVNPLDSVVYGLDEFQIDTVEERVSRREDIFILKELLS